MAYKTQFDVERFEARQRTLKGPTHIVERNWKYNNGYNNHNDGSAYEQEMVAQGIWKRCEKCGVCFSPRYGHDECKQVEAV
jgi:hypothetical protein